MIKASLLKSFPSLRVKTFIEGKILEKTWAERSGLGNRGKNSLIFLDRYGSRVLLGEILISSELKAKQALRKEICDGCSLCLEACPTKALCSSYIVRPDLCLDYFSLHYEGIIPLKIRQAMGVSLFGCSLCQEVCPLNREPIYCEEAPPGPGEFFPLERALTLKEDEFRKIFQGHSFRRVTFLRFQRNALIAAGNSREQFLWDLIYPFAFSPLILLRQHSLWSLWMTNPSRALHLFHKIRQKETDPRLLGEIKKLEELTRQDGR